MQWLVLLEAGGGWGAVRKRLGTLNDVQGKNRPTQVCASQGKPQLRLIALNIDTILVLLTQVTS